MDGGGCLEGWLEREEVACVIARGRHVDGLILAVGFGVAAQESLWISPDITACVWRWLLQ